MSGGETAKAPSTRTRATTPRLSPCAVRILERIFAGDASAAELTTLIERDPFLAASLLRIANTRVLGLRYEVTSVQHAIMLLGIETLQRLALSLSLRESFENGLRSTGTDASRLWKHSIATAVGARLLAIASGNVNPEEAYVAGLLHDLGYLGLEDAAMGENEAHALAGKKLATEWNLPCRYMLVMEHHHHPENARHESKCIHDLVRIVSVSNYLAWMCGYPPGRETAQPHREHIDEEILSQVDLEELLLQIREELDRLTDGRDSLEDEHWERLLVRANETLASTVQHLENRNRQLETLHHLLMVARGGMGSNSPTQTLLMEIVAEFGFDRAWVLEIDPDVTYLRVHLTIPFDKAKVPDRERTIAILPDEDVQLGGSWIFDKTSTDGLVRRILDHFGAGAAVILPIEREHSVRFLFGADVSGDKPLPVTNREILDVLAVESGLLLQNQELLEKVSEMAITDPLTRVSNRRNLMESLRNETEVSSRTGRPLSVAMIDLDHFKNVNDRLGHQAGDELLQAVAKILKANVRKGDLIGRYGGEEFVVVLPGADRGRAMEVGLRICHAVRAFGKENRDRYPGCQITTSLGVAELCSEKEDYEGLLGRADKALYEAKDSGRDRVVRAETPE